MAKPVLLSFDEDASVFADYGVSIRGMVRYKLTQKNLTPYLDQKQSLRVLDVGGGSGPDAAWLAHAGHTVCMLEPARKQREYARRRFNFFLSESVRSRITIHPKGLDDFKIEPRYDVVVVHGVAMYQPKPEQFIVRAAACVKPGGIISVVEKGYYGAEARAVQAKDFVGLRRLRRTRRAINHLGRDVWAFKPEELEQMLVKQAKTDILEWSGIRLLTDELTIRSTIFDEDIIKDILEVEHEHGHNPSIRGQGQMLHFIARKQV